MTTSVSWDAPASSKKAAKADKAFSRFFVESLTAGVFKMRYLFARNALLNDVKSGRIQHYFSFLSGLDHPTFRLPVKNMDFMFPAANGGSTTTRDAIIGIRLRHRDVQTPLGYEVCPFRKVADETYETYRQQSTILMGSKGVG